MAREKDERARPRVDDAESSVEARGGKVAAVGGELTAPYLAGGISTGRQ